MSFFSVFVKLNFCYLCTIARADNKLTYPTRGPYSEESDVITLGVVKKFDDFLEYNGQGRNTYTMLQ